MADPPPPWSAAGFTAGAATGAAAPAGGALNEPLVHHLRIPGCALPLRCERDRDGRLRRISAGERVYVDVQADGQTHYDGGFVTTQLVELPHGLLRRVRVHGEGHERHWTERYGWDAQGRLVEVDGVDITHDGRGRVTACIDRHGGGAWHYGYTGDELTVIQTPQLLRHLLHDGAGQPLGWRERGPGVTREGWLRHDAEGARLPARSTPQQWELDAAGRLLAVRDAWGRVQRSYLWDGWLCLAAIDGEPGAPLAEVYSLDPGGTPVRVCGRRSVQRLPRDAYGEGLVQAHDPACPRPGLYGGAIADDGLVHLPYRRLDPRLACFDRRDPLHGEASDPRRAGGFKGPLQIELPAAGPYTVCRHNPVTLTDPTGAISDLWWLIPSALTWSMQNTVGSLLGMWLNLEFSPLGWIVSALAGAQPFDAEWISAQNHDVFGLRADGWLSRIQPVAWTYQFLVNEEKISFTALEDARLFNPDAAFRPTLYGSLLRCAPAGSAGFVLRGMRGGPNATALPDWSRCGGTAEAALPGSLLPVFPAGGLHFNTVQRGVRKQRADMIEVVPGDTVSTGIAGTYAALTVPATGLNIALKAELALTDSAGAMDIVRVLDADELAPNTVLQVDPAPARLAAGSELRLQGLSAPAGTEALTPVAADPRLLSITGSSGDYVPGVSVLRLARGGSVVHVARVDALEAQLALDAAVPAAVGNDFLVRGALASGNFTGKLGPNPADYEVQSGTAPGPGSGIVVGSGAAALPALVVSAAGAVLTLDRDLSALGAPGTAQPWQQLAPAGDLGAHAGAPEAAAQVTYVPTTIATAPANGFVWLQGAQAAVRRITARTYDAIVLAPPRPDALAAPYDTTRWRTAAPDVAKVTFSNVQLIALDAALPAGATALHVLPFSGATVAAAADLFAAATIVTLAAGTPPVASTSVAAGAVNGSVRPGDVVVVTPAAGAAVPGAIRRLRLTVTLDRALALSGGAVEAALLAPDTQAYTATRIDALVLQLQVPVVGGLRLDMPRFVPGELMLVNYTDAGSAQQRHYVVAASAGMTLTLADDAAIPATASAISVTRLQVQDPATGSSRWGLEGTVVAGNQLTFSVWSATAGLGQPRLAVIDGASVHAVQLTNAAQPLAIELALAGDGTPQAGAVRLGSPAAAAGAVVTANFVADNLTLRLPATPAAAPPGNAVALVPYVDGAQRVAGELNAGAVRMPDDHENAALQLARRQALEDHELSHTVQFARLGPIMLVAFPLWAFELANDLTAGGGPAFSPYLAGTLADGVLTPSNAADFATGGKVQAAQNRRVQTLTLGPAADGGGFRLGDGDRRALGAAGFADGAVQLRRPLGGTGNDVLEWITNIGQLLTIGGLMNILTLGGWGGLAALIVQVVQGIRYAARSKLSVPLADDHVTLTLPAGQTPEGLHDGVLLALKSGDQIFVRAADKVMDRTITLGAAVPLQGEVELSVYSPGAALFGLRSYFPATVPDGNQPARLAIASMGSDVLTLAVHDRVEVRASSGSAHRTLVTRVDGTQVELEEAVLLRDDQPNEFLIAKIAAQDPSGWLDGWLLNELHLGWMQYVHDPWGQILYRAPPASDNVLGQILARSARYLFGTQSWMCCFLGYFWNDNAYQRANPHRSLMEQEASRRSGDTYCPLGTLHGDVVAIGDVARYWVTVSGGTRDGTGNTPNDLITFGQQDAPTLNLTSGPTVTFPAASPFALPGALYTLNAAGALSGPGARAFIPTDNVLERSAGMHVAFTRPAPAGNPYRITAQGLSGLSNSLDAQSNGVATIFFDRSPSDVTVTTAGIPVPEAGATPLQLLPFQHARFDVTPNGSRVYRLTVGGPGRGFDAADLTLTAHGTLGTDDAEISRYHHYNGSSYDSGIGPIHLPADLDIAVRRFRVAVVNTVPLRATADHLAPAIASYTMASGDAFLLVPSALAPLATTVTVAGRPPVNATVVAATATLSAQTTAFLDTGAAFQLQVPADQPPEATVHVVVTLHVGPDAASAVAVTCEFDLSPPFTLDAPSITVAPGATVTLTASDGTTLQAAPAPAGVTLTANAAQLQVQVDAGVAVGTDLVVRAIDAGNAGRQARRVVEVR